MREVFSNRTSKNNKHVNKNHLLLAVYMSLNLFVLCQAFMKGILKLKGNMMLAQKLGELLKPGPAGSTPASKVLH